MPSSNPAVIPSSEPTREASLAALVDRYRELSETRERETATAEIVRAISESPTDAQPVFESIVLTAARLLNSIRAFVLLCDGGAFSVAAAASPEGVLAPRGGKTPIDPSANFASRAILAKEKLYYMPDYSRIELPEFERKIREMYGVNSSLFLPLVHQDECFGLLTLIAQQADAFGPGEIPLAESFRDQAVIAIQNERLFNETQEALQQQTATAEVLKVISRSAFDLQTVLDTLTQSAARLCEADMAAIARQKNEAYYYATVHNFPVELDKYLKSVCRRVQEPWSGRVPTSRYRAEQQAARPPCSRGQSQAEGELCVGLSRLGGRELRSVHVDLGYRLLGRELGRGVDLH
jgi:hypothetical protein